MKKWSYLSSWATNHKTNDTLLSQTIKVEEKKCPYFFDLWPRSRDMAISSFEGQEVKYAPSSKEVKANMNKKTKDTLLSQYLKVEEKKVSLFL